MIKLDDWAKCQRHLFSTRVSRREIARLAGVSGGTVDRALAEDREPTYQRTPTGSSFDAFTVEERRLLGSTPTRPSETTVCSEFWRSRPPRFGLGSCSREQGASANQLRGHEGEFIPRSHDLESRFTTVGPRGSHAAMNIISEGCGVDANRK